MNDSSDEDLIDDYNLRLAVVEALMSPTGWEGIILLYAETYKTTFKSWVKDFAEYYNLDYSELEGFIGEAVSIASYDGMLVPSVGVEVCS